MTPVPPHDELRARRRELAQLDARLGQVMAERSAAEAELRAAQLSADRTVVDQSRQRVLAAERHLRDIRRRTTTTEETIGDLRRTLYPTLEATFRDLETSQPILLLPVRLEARFAWQDPATNEHTFERPSGTVAPLLLVRIYPDDIHVESHRRALSPDEGRWRDRFRARLAHAIDRGDFIEAWSELLDHLPASRAAWIGDPRAGPVLAGPADWQGRGMVRVLPDRWMGVAWTDQDVLTAESELAREVLRVAPDPAAAHGGTDDPNLRWLWDFRAALTAGMALQMPMTATSSTTAPRVRRLVVFGVRASSPPGEAATELTALLDAHHFTDGLAFLRPGAPTNNTPGTRVDHTSRPDAIHVFEVEGDMAPLRPHRTLVDNPASDGAQTAELLGLDRSVFGHVEGADRLAHRLGPGVQVRLILARAVEPTVRRLLGPRFADPQADAAVEELIGFFVQHVTGVGPLPVLRVGNQPYGILPTTVLHAHADDDMHDLFGGLTDALDRIRALVWEPAVDHVPRIGGEHPSGHAGKLLDILRTDGATTGAWVRIAAPRRLAQAILGTYGISMATTRAEIMQLLSQLGMAVSGHAPPELVDTVFLTGPVQVDLPFANTGDSDPAASPAALRDALELIALMKLSLADFDLLSLSAGDRGTGQPQSLLLALGRLAVLATADRACRRLLGADGIDPAIIEAWDREVLTPADPLARLSDRLAAELSFTPGQPIHRLLLGPNAPPDADPLQSVRSALRALARPDPATPDATYPPELLDMILRTELGLLSHRLDAWYTGLATRRLLDRRAGQAAGTYVGAWGVLEDLVPKALVEHQGTTAPGTVGKVYTEPTNAGYVHAPSASHATAAAVLRCAHLAHHADLDGGAFSIDLSSRRVRRARWLLDGIRNGQPLSALLGYQIERQLKHTAPQLIDVVRRAAPLVANKLTSPAGPVENVAAENVVDGLALLGKAGYSTTTPISSTKLQQVPGLADIADAQVVEAAVLDAIDAVDAVADVLLADGVLQQVQGNPARAGGAVDSISAAPVAPAEPDIARSTRTGVVSTHRVCVALPPDDGTAPGDEAAGWATSPRARAEPSLERWARDALPRPADIVVPVAATEDGKTTYAGATLAELHQAVPNGTPLGWFRMSALDFVLLANPERSGPGDPLEERLLTMFRELGVTSTAAVLKTLSGRSTEPDAVPAGGWTAELFSLTEAIEIGDALRQLTLNARTLRAADLVPPGTPPTHEADLSAVGARLVTAQQELDQLATDLQAGSQDVTTFQGLLARADSFGLASCLLPLGSTPPQSSHRVLDDLNRVRAGAINEIQDRLNRARQIVVTSVDKAQECAEALFGRGFVILTGLSSIPETTPGYLEKSASPAGADAASARQFVSRSARVRVGVGRLDRHLGYADALHQHAPALTVTQLPLAAGDRWVALAFDPTTGEPLAGRLALMTHTPIPIGSSSLTGLLVDEWLETTPNRRETTSLTFHYDAPTSAAPNVFLLAVAPPATRWSPALLRETIVEALAIARLRAVDPDILDGMGQILPPLWTVENTAGDAASMNVLSLLGAG
jgi:hypothetical protein